jgi:hypothetical protein
VVVDARTGRVLTTWRGGAARAVERDTSRPARARSAAVQPGTRSAPMIVLDDKLAPGPQTEGGRYGTWRATLPQSVASNWASAPTLISSHAFNADLDAAIRNAKDVAVYLCVTRSFCSRNGTDNPRKPFQLTGADDVGQIQNGGASYNPGLDRVFLDRVRGHQNDVIAHEVGHLIHFVRAHDLELATREEKEVSEGLADMFAYDFDRGDATLGEDEPFGPGTGGGSLRRWDTPLNGEPLRMADYHCFPPGDDAHVNAEILGHAYFAFVGQVGADAAGYLLHLVPATVGPKPSYTATANAFVQVAETQYAGHAQIAAARAQGVPDRRRADQRPAGLHPHRPAPAAAPAAATTAPAAAIPGCGARRARRLTRGRELRALRGRSPRRHAAQRRR